MIETSELVILIDVDNTLVDNDQIQADMGEYLLSMYGAEVRDRYWVIFEEIRSELGYADYLGALERYRIEAMHDPRILRMANWLVDYPFADRLYPGALDAVRHAQKFGRAVILSDGDAVFHTYSTYARGGESVTDAYRLLDLTPYGRQEDFEESPEGWPQRPTYG